LSIYWNELDCCGWLNLNDALSFSDVQSTIEYMRCRDVIVGDVKCFDQFLNQRLLYRVFRMMKI
jgi:hypothetical protein